MEEVDDMKLTSCSFQILTQVGYGIPKGSWDFEVEFVGTIDGDDLEGVYYPDTIFNGTIKDGKDFKGEKKEVGRMRITDVKVTVWEWKDILNSLRFELRARVQNQLRWA